MKKTISIILCLAMCVLFVSCGNNFEEEKAALVGTKWFSAENTSNSIVVWNFYEESVERAGYFVDGNGMHDSDKEVAEYEIQKDVIKVSFEDEEILIPYTFANGKINLKAGEYFSPEDVDKAIQGCWNLRQSSTFLGITSSNEYNIQFDNGTMIIEEAAEAINGGPGEYYYYGPYEGTYTIGDGTFETDAKMGDRYFFNV